MKHMSALWMLAFALSCLAHAQEPPLKLEQSILLPGVSGRIDHLTLDASGRHLWLAALGNNTVEVLDLDAGRHIKSIRGLQEPQGICLDSSSKRIFVASGEDGALRAYNDAFELVASLGNLDDADNLRLDPAEKRIYVGYGRGAIAVIDAEALTRLAEIKLDDHPESFQLEQQGRRIFVNVPGARHVAVVDRDKQSVIATWPVTGALANFPMALDETHHRIFVGCRNPARLVVVDTESGKSVASMECCGDADDVFYDALRRRIYVSGGEGFISVFEQRDPDHYRLLSRTETGAGARTSLFVPQADRLYLAVPKRAGHEAQVREYRTGPS